MDRKLVEKRRLAGISQELVARFLGVHVMQLSRIERGVVVLPPGFEERYAAALKAIAGGRAEVVGVELEPEYPDPAEMGQKIAARVARARRERDPNGG